MKNKTTKNKTANGWPDLRTASDYRRYEAAVKRGCQGLTNISSGACPGCDECGLEEDCSDQERQLNSEPGFSWSECDICGRDQGGMRTPAHGLVTLEHGREILVHLMICDDCVTYLEYGKLDDQTMSEVQPLKTPNPSNP